MIPDLNTVVFHWVALDSYRKHYRGVARGDLNGLLCIIAAEQTSKLEILSPCLKEYHTTMHDEGSNVTIIPFDKEMVCAIYELSKTIDWEDFHTEIHVDHEFIASYVCSESIPISEKDIISAVVNKVHKQGVRITQQPVFYGFDILEWPSCWSLPINHGEWDELTYDLNQYILFNTWEEANEAWNDYLKVEDDHRGELDWYRIVGVVGLGELEVD